MKRYLPFVFPAAAVLVVVFLTYRWYSHNTTGVGQISEFAEGIEIEELTDAEQSGVIRGVGDISTIQLEQVAQDTDSGEDSSTDQSSQDGDMASTASGQVRYEITDGRVRFSVSAALSTPEMGYYQVWLKAVDSDAIRRAFVLEMSKGGYMGSAAISADTLPFEVLVSLETADTNAPTKTILRGVVQAELDKNQE